MIIQSDLETVELRYYLATAGVVDWIHSPF